MDHQPDHYGAVDTTEDPATIPRSESRLKRLSGVTANRLSIPFSLFSFRSSRTSDSEGKRLSKHQNGVAKSSQPSESTRSLTATEPQPPDEQDAVGQLPTLPVLGTARGGYLRSLLSLFSDGQHDNDGRSTQTATPVSEHTPMSDISPYPWPARSLGLYEYDLGSPVIYRFSKNHQLYIGWPDVVNPPPEALVEFETETLPLLEQDLQGICAHLSQQDVRITYELRMSGHADLAAGTVTLAPTVWILYRSYTLAGNVVTGAALNQVALGLDYLQTDIEIHEGGGRIEASSDRKLVDLDLDAADDDAASSSRKSSTSTATNNNNRESIQLFNGAVLSVHVEDCRARDTACGALVCVTVQEDRYHTQQSLCRLGGLLKINGKYVLGVTTAHAMLDSSGIFKDSFEGGAAGDGGDLRTPKGKAVDRDAIVLEAGEVEAGGWQPVTRDAAIDFLGISMNSRGDVALNRAAPQNATDFAMLRLRDMPSGIRNRYVPPGSDGPPVSIRSTASASSSALDEGPVYILGGAGRVLDAQLVWGSVCIIIRGRNFRVRRVQTSQPLGPAASGSWVVKGEVLYGVIIAVYKDEPFALMMTAERLFESILGSAFSVRTVELWDGVLLPEADKPERVGRTCSSTTTATTAASSSKIISKRDSSTRTNCTRTQTESSSRPSTLTRNSTTQVRDFQLKADGDGPGPGVKGGGPESGEADGDPAEVLGLHPALRGQGARDKRAAKRASVGNRAGRLLAPTAQVRSYLDKKLPMLVRRASRGKENKGKDVKGKKVDRGTPSERA